MLLNRLPVTKRKQKKDIAYLNSDNVFKKMKKKRSSEPNLNNVGLYTR